jgi:formamidopyrimidine-DNA glycosylase
MPELPEVESLRRVLAASALGRTIVSASIKESRLRRAVDAGLAQAIGGRTIEALRRRAKYLLFELSDKKTLIVHLGMSGSLTYRASGFDRGRFDSKHDHIFLNLDDGAALVYNDPRRFGLMKVVDHQALDNLPEFRAIGPEPMSARFSVNYLSAKARGKKVAIKNLIMDQHIVAGIGNIYASEILFRAGVRPTRRAGRVRRIEIERIVAATRAILKAAIGSRGTTFRSYFDSRGEPGQFSRKLQVYGRAGEPCYACSTAIKDVVVGQRASSYCPRCQK